MSWVFSNDKPIFQQLIDKISIDIISEKYKPGERIDAVRELSVDAGVNPNTMQRALTLIEESGLIYTKRGDGKFVTEDINVISDMREKIIRENVCKFISSMYSLGVENTEMLKILERELNGG